MDADAVGEGDSWLVVMVVPTSVCAISGWNGLGLGPVLGLGVSCIVGCFSVEFSVISVPLNERILKLSVASVPEPSTPEATIRVHERS